MPLPQLYLSQRLLPPGVCPLHTLDLDHSSHSSFLPISPWVVPPPTRRSHFYVTPFHIVFQRIEVKRLHYAIDFKLVIISSFALFDFKWAFILHQQFCCDQSKEAPKLCLSLEIFFSSPSDNSSPNQLEPISLFPLIYPAA